MTFKNLLKYYLLIILIFCTSCANPPKSWGWGVLRPRPLSGMSNFPDVDTEYGKGFRDGCGAGFDAVSKGLLSDIHGKGYDFKRMKKSPDYNLGWFDGLEQCTYIMDHDVT